LTWLDKKYGIQTPVALDSWEVEIARALTSSDDIEIRPVMETKPRIIDRARAWLNRKNKPLKTDDPKPDYEIQELKELLGVLAS
jgi:hypothetical protein